MLRKTWLEINLDNFKKNCQYLIDHTNKKLIAVIKANGYGLGDRYLAKCAIDAGCSMLAVSSIEEALIVREVTDKDILILGYVDPKEADYLKKYDISCAVVSLSWVKELINEDCKGVKVHLKVDTGMNRIGIKDKKELKEAYDLLVSHGVEVEGIFTHYACSDDLNSNFTNEQFAKFKEAYDYLNVPFKYIHCDNSDAAIDFKDDLTNAIRCGIAMLGYASNDKDLLPVCSLYTQITNVKKVNKGETIGYGATYRLDDDEIIATIPIGYADGFIRRNQGRKVYVDGIYAPLVGRICMDQCMIKLPYMIDNRTKVELFGKHISLQLMAKELDTITYEILCNLSSRLTRIYILDGKKCMECNSRLETINNGTF